MLVNVGCGSGLCGIFLSERNILWTGLDISTSMLHEAVTREKTRSACEGRVVVADCSTRLPFKQDAFESAISISVLQWLCVHPQPQHALDSFMKEISRCILDNGSLIAQIYPRSEDDCLLMLESVERAGLCGYMCVDFPHQTKAKKFFLCATVDCGAKQKHGIDAVDSTACILAWPFQRGVSCSLVWLAACGATAPDAKLIKDRLFREHIRYSRHMLRVLKRAVMSDLSAPDMEGFSAEISLCNCSQYVPCGGPLLLHIWSENTIEPVVVDSIISQLLHCGVHSRTLVEYAKRAVHVAADWPKGLISVADRKSGLDVYFKLKLITTNEHSSTGVLTAEKVPQSVVLTMNIPMNDEEPIWDCSGTHMRIAKLIARYHATLLALDVIMSRSKNNCSVAWLMYIPEQRNVDRLCIDFCA